MTEKLKLPKEEVDTAGLDYETYGTPRQEMEYESPEDVSKESIEKIKSIDLKQRFKDRGHKVRSLFSLEKAAA